MVSYSALFCPWAHPNLPIFKLWILLAWDKHFKIQGDAHLSGSREDADGRLIPSWNGLQRDGWTGRWMARDREIEDWQINWIHTSEGKSNHRQGKTRAVYLNAERWQELSMWSNVCVELVARHCEWLCEWCTVLAVHSLWSWPSDSCVLSTALLLHHQQLALQDAHIYCPQIFTTFWIILIRLAFSCTPVPHLGRKVSCSQW